MGEETERREPLKLTEKQCSRYYLEPVDIRIFENFPFHSQKVMLQEWKSMKPFLSRFPARKLPKKFFRIPRGKNRPFFKFHYGWATNWAKIVDWVQAHHPEAVRLDPRGKPDPVATGLDCVGLIAQQCGLEYLTVQTAWTGPRTSDLRPVLAISSNYESSAHRKGLSTEGVEKLKDYFGLEGPARWMMDPLDIKYWPTFGE
ncbi:hypothetical protein D9757_006910 [Collybiopsis confluens]|uniref:Uncharacterized protein n=1 Tax=Collybiopsis confluens TaxID=2823264 RepID=A0A8H5M7X4_9AGAR|nr:hypothetical protein D9757_006910 [Collybiopsis confluens]